MNKPSSRKMSNNKENTINIWETKECLISWGGKANRWNYRNRIMDEYKRYQIIMNKTSNNMIIKNKGCRNNNHNKIKILNHKQNIERSL